MKTFNITPQELIDYIWANAELETPGTRDVINIYYGPSGLTHTRGSMEYRDDDHDHVITVELLNEHAPYTHNDIQGMIQYEIEQENLILNGVFS